MSHFNRKLFISLIMGAAFALPVASFAKVDKVIVLEATRDVNTPLFVRLKEGPSSKMSLRPVDLRAFYSGTMPPAEIGFFNTAGFHLDRPGNFGDTGSEILLDADSTVAKKLQGPYYANLRKYLVWNIGYWERGIAGALKPGFTIRKGDEGESGMVGFFPDAIGYQYDSFKKKAGGDFGGLVIFDDVKKRVIFDFNKTQG